MATAREVDRNVLATCLNTLPRLHRYWKIMVRTQILEACADLGVLEKRAPDGNDGDVGRAYLHLAEACQIINRRRLARYVPHGGDIDAAFVHVHAAMAVLPLLSTYEELRPRAPFLVAKANRLLPESDRRGVAELAASRGDDSLHDQDVGYARNFAEVLREVYKTCDERYAQLRRFRNNLLIVGGLVSIVVVFLVIIGLRSPGAIPLCFESTINQGTVVSCPTSESKGSLGQLTDRSVLSGSRGPNGRASDDDVLVVALLGAAGGLLSGALAVKRLRPRHAPYDVPLWNFFLKLPVGALTAIGGLVLISGEIVPGLSALDSQGQILAYALLFGLAQQILTRYVDARAAELLLGVPSRGRKSQTSGDELSAGTT